MRIWQQLLAVLVIGALGTGGYYAWRLYIAPAEETSEAPQASREIAVEVGEAAYRTMRRTVEAVGTSRARQSIEIVALASGRVEEVAFRPGQHVDAGDVLVRLDDDIERANLAEAEARSTEQTQALARVEQLRGTNAVAPSSLEQAAAAKAAADAEVDRSRRRLADRVIRAPFAGVVGLSDIDLGARVDDQTVLTTLDDLTEVEVQFSLPETLFGGIAVDQPISAQSAAFPDKAFAGKVAHIDSRVDPVSRAFKVRAVVPNPEEVLPAGMFMSLTLTLSEADELVVPEEAIVLQAANAYVFVVDQGRATRRPVATGQRHDGVVAVVSGLEAGEVVVIRGLQRIRDGSTVRILGEPAAASPTAEPEEGT
jgi:membrane fusion protein (multidrug efflux system)